MTANGTLKTRRPQLADSIGKLNEVIEGLSVEVPAVVADTLKEALGADFAAAIGRAVADALRPLIAEAVRAEVASAVAAIAPAPVAKPTQPPAPPKPPMPVAPPKPSLWKRLGDAARDARAWAGRRLDAVMRRAALGWAMARLLGVAVAYSRTAAASALAVGGISAVTAAVAGPVAAAVLLSLAAATITATAVSVAPLVHLAVVMGGHAPARTATTRNGAPVRTETPA